MFMIYFIFIKDVINLNSDTLVSFVIDVYYENININDEMITNDNNIITSKRTECKMWCKKLYTYACYNMAEYN